MTIHTQAWESTLLSLAYEAVHQINLPEKPLFDQNLLEEAYAYCDSVTAIHSRSFHLASALLPYEKKRAVRALYAFCRISDDIVDSAVSKQFVANAYQDIAATKSPDSLTSIEKATSSLPATPTHEADLILHELEVWRRCILGDMPQQEDLVAIAWADARAKYNVPHKYAVQLIDGVARDLYQNRYSDFSELAAYCYGVASTVGLMSMHIVGYAGEEAIPYAIKLGVALQLTNILRDIAEDFQAGRVYLPQTELSEFGLSDADIGHGIKNATVSAHWRKFMQFQIDRNRRLYTEAMPGIQLLDPDGRFAIAAAAELYRGILSDIEKNDYNIFTRRSHVPRWKKLAVLPGIFIRTL